MTVINVTNKETLYNFLSRVSGTHFVTPRALTAELGSTSNERELIAGRAGHCQ